MTVEELQSQLLELQNKYDTLNNDIKKKDELIEGFKNKEVENVKKISEYQENIMRLRDMNTELFLKVSQPIPQEEVTDTKAEEITPQEETITLDEIMGVM